MSEPGDKKVYVIGHKNPDTDSICSAIAYAELKRQITGGVYVAKRAGEINEETQYVLRRFKVPAPAYLADVKTQVKDIEIHHIDGVEGNISLKTAWSLMQENNITTLPITKNNKLEGLISIGDITKSYMEVYDSSILSRAKTQYRNMLETLDGELIVGNAQDYFTKGKVVIAAASPDLMEEYIEDDDLVILGNRYESQLCAIEMNASCIIVCEGAKVTHTIKRLAEQQNCVVISTPHDTFTVARLINQSISIRYFMKAGDMTVFRTTDYIENIRSVMARKRHRNFPIEDKKGNYVGMISRRNLLSQQRKQVILVDHNEVSQAVDGIEEAEILEIIDHHRLGTLQTVTPVMFRNQPLGCTATILYQMYHEYDVRISPVIAGLLCAAIISDTLMFRSPTCTPADRAAAEELARTAGIEMDSFAREMFHAGSNLKKKTEEEIFYQDYKKFHIAGVDFGVGQINSMDRDELEKIKKRLDPYIMKKHRLQGKEMVFFMLTDIIGESTELLCYGSNSRKVVEEAFGVPEEQELCILNGIVSRKKQLIPALMTALQQ